MLEQLIEHLITSFDFGYCLVINILTYLIVKIVDGSRTKTLSTWQKRIVLLCAILFVGTGYYLIGIDLRILFNSSILAPVSWSWIFKPIAKKLKLDYNKSINNEEIQ